jgi:hypothetical protein
MADLDDLMRAIFEGQAPRRRPPPEIQILEPIPAEIVDAEIVRDVASHVQQDVVSHVQRHLDTSEITRQVEKLGDRVEAADDDMNAHLQNVFDHEVGMLRAGGEGAPHSEALRQLSSSDIANLLREPQSIRRAILVSELLNRPEHRWE